MTPTTLSVPREQSPPLSFVQALFQWESVVYAIICLSDLASTLYFIHHGEATEANPILAPAVQQGDGVFCLAKLLSFVPMLLLAAWYRQQKPKFIAVALRIAIVAYVVIYAVGVGSQFLGQ